MKKCMLALVVLGAYADVTSAQSTVTLYGTLDVSGRYVNADGQSHHLSEATDGINPSRLGFRGTEDLGDGLNAGFTFETGTNPDTGTANAKFWNRRSTVSLFGRFGEVRLGRDFTPTFWSNALFDAFGYNGLGASFNPRQLYGGTRMDNTIGYFLPSNLGGFYGQAMVASGEGGTSADRPGRYVGARVGFAAGPFEVGFAAGQQRFAVPLGLAAAGDTQNTYNIGGSWNFGVAKLMGYYDRETLNSYHENMGSISAVIPFGLSEVHVGYDRSRLTLPSGASSSVDQIKATYQYNLSKRTAIYATASRMDNKDATRLTLPGAAGLTTAGGKSQGAEFGLRHFF